MGTSKLSEIDAIFNSRPAGRSAKSAEQDTKKRKSVGVEGRGDDGRRAEKAARRPSVKSKGKEQQAGKTTTTTTTTSKSSSSDAPHDVPLILDPSQTILASSSLNPKNIKTKVQKPRLEDDEEERAFRDSRGSRPRTEDGLLIYSVEELKIGLGQDTPECPFDCQCCF